ncbi:extracellular solute-binding protein [Patescibacteria group bacterium]|nr:extracellular solute-binding protein [Patescibacteria group bacterium]
MSQFQLIVTSIFGFFILIGVILFASFKTDRNDLEVGSVLIWGTVADNVIADVLHDLVNRDSRFEKVKYEQIDEINFDSILAEAMAEDKGPDLFFLPQDKIIKHQKKILTIPYETFSLRDFKDYFIEEGELYLTDTGILALPFMVDPMVMYWNRNIHTKVGISEPPSYWDSFFAFAKKVTDKDENMNILTSAVALGEYENINHSKEILAALIMQTGNPIVLRDGEEYDVVLKKSLGSQSTATESSLRFYTEFSDPIKETYSWNRSMPNSKNSFLSGDLALYFGFASELEDLRNKNPNLNFDVSFFPQTGDSKNIVNFGKMEALAISKSSKNAVGAYTVATALIQSETLLYLNEVTGLPPVSRIILAKEPIDPYQNVFFKAALSSRGFLDINKEDTDFIFQDMVNSVVSGRRKLSEAVSRADAEMNELLR